MARKRLGGEAERRHLVQRAVGLAAPARRAHVIVDEGVGHRRSPGCRRKPRRIASDGPEHSVAPPRARGAGWAGNAVDREISFPPPPPIVYYSAFTVGNGNHTSPASAPKRCKALRDSRSIRLQSAPPCGASNCGTGIDPRHHSRRRSLGADRSHGGGRRAAGGPGLSDPGDGDRASDRHRAQPVGAAPVVPARDRILAEGDPALGGRAARPARGAWRDRGAGLVDRRPGRRRDGDHGDRGLPAGAIFGQSAAYGALAGAGTAVCGASATLATSIVLPDYQGKEADVAFR